MADLTFDHETAWLGFRCDEYFHWDHPAYLSTFLSQAVPLYVEAAEEEDSVNRSVILSESYERRISCLKVTNRFIQHARCFAPQSRNAGQHDSSRRYCKMILLFTVLSPLIKPTLRFTKSVSLLPFSIFCESRARS